MIRKLGNAEVMLTTVQSNTWYIILSGFFAGSGVVVVGCLQLEESGISLQPVPPLPQVVPLHCEAIQDLQLCRVGHGCVYCSTPFDGDGIRVNASWHMHRPPKGRLTVPWHSCPVWLEVYELGHR